MDFITPNTRTIQKYQEAEYTGGAKFRNGDTLLARITPCLENGKTAFVDILDEGEIAFGSTEFIVMRAIEGLSDSKFVYYLATSPFLRDIAIKSMVGSSGRQRVQQNVIENTMFNFPDLPVQRSIAATLSSLDDKIELNNRIIANLEAQAQAIFKSWFVDFEPFQDGEFEDGELGLIPKGWRVGTISEVAQINPDSVKTSESSCPIEYLDTSNITRGSVLEIQKFENLLAAPSRARRRVIDGDIVYSTVRPNQLHFGMIVNPSSQLLVSTGFTVVRCVEKFISKYYIYLALTQQNTIEYYQQLAETTTSTFPAIRADDIGSYSIVIPPGDIIKDYHAVVARLFEDVKNRYQQNSSLQHLRDALLPKLMSGEIEVPVEG
jgi:type I restriction enzyme S subunit